MKTNDLPGEISLDKIAEEKEKNDPVKDVWEIVDLDETSFETDSRLYSDIFHDGERTDWEVAAFQDGHNLGDFNVIYFFPDEGSSYQLGAVFIQRCIDCQEPIIVYVRVYDDSFTYKYPTKGKLIPCTKS